MTTAVWRKKLKEFPVSFHSETGDFYCSLSGKNHWLESVLKPSKQPKKDTGKGDNSVKIECFLLVSGGKTAMVLEFEE